MRKTKFANNEYYHIYNRGTDKREIFCDEKDYLRFLVSMREFNNESSDAQRDYEKRKAEKNGQNLKPGFGYPKPGFRFLDMPKLVEVICYCLNPNHYHFILKQSMDNGIEKFMHKLGLGYVKYFNTQYDRSGHLFQGPFKSIHIDTNEYLLWLSGYVNGNSEIHEISEAENYKWCSYLDYLEKRNGTLCNKEIILSQFKNIEEYQKYTEMVIKESSERKNLEEYFIEEI